MLYKYLCSLNPKIICIAQFVPSTPDIQKTMDEGIFTSKQKHACIEDIIVYYSDEIRRTILVHFGEVCMEVVLKFIFCVNPVSIYSRWSLSMLCLVWLEKLISAKVLFLFFFFGIKQCLGDRALRHYFI